MGKVDELLAKLREVEKLLEERYDGLRGYLFAVLSAAKQAVEKAFEVQQKLEEVCLEIESVLGKDFVREPIDVVNELNRARVSLDLAVGNLEAAEQILKERGVCTEALQLIVNALWDLVDAAKCQHMVRKHMRFILSLGSKVLSGGV